LVATKTAYQFCHEFVVLATTHAFSSYCQSVPGPVQFFPVEVFFSQNFTC